MQGLFQELNRRNVFRVAIAYLVASWVVLQIVDVIVPILELPDWTAKLVFVILAVGLVPALIFAWAFEMTPEGLKREEDVDRDASIKSTTAHRLNYLIIGTLAIAVAFLLFDRQTGGPEAVVETPAEETMGSAPSEASIAVLPFVNMSDDKDYFADGITEEILNALASVKGLKVAGRTSSFAFKGQNDDLRRIGDALGVEHILEGSVRKSGDTVRITAQLIHVDDGFHLWSDTYDRQLVDVFQVQDEISREILSQLSTTLLSNETNIEDARRTNPEAYELYLRAKQRMYTRERPAIELAVEDLNRAIEIDPGYAPAYAQRGIAALLLSESQYGSTPYDESIRRGKRFIDLALNIDPELPEALAGKGLYESRIGGDIEVSIDALSRALELNPNLIDARNWLQASLSVSGQHRAAMEITREIAEIDPLYMPAFSNGIINFAAFGEEELAEKWISRLEKFDPENPRLLFARAVNSNINGRPAEALKYMEELQSKAPLSGVQKIVLTGALWGTGQFERALEQGFPFWKPALLHRLGRIDEAYELARQQAVAGISNALIGLYSRDGRHRELTDFIEERWPTLESFAAEYPGDEWGYDDMLSIALAYEQTGTQRRFSDAMTILEAWENNLLEQGVSNLNFSMTRAQLYALRGDREMAVHHLTQAVDKGWVDAEGFDQGWPILARYADDPRMIELERRILQRANEARAAIDLPPLDQPVEVTTGAASET